jgi:hypothetical protein
VADEPVVLLFLSTLSDGRRLACYQEDPPRTDGVMIDQVGPVDPEAPFHGRKARDWPDGTYRVRGDRLVRDEAGDPLTVAIDRYRERFGTVDLTLFAKSAAELDVAAALMNRAVERGRRTSDDEYFPLIGLQPLPPDIVI